MGYCLVNPLYKNKSNNKWVLREKTLVVMVDNMTPKPFNASAFQFFDNNVATGADGIVTATLLFGKGIMIKSITGFRGGVNYLFLEGLKKDGTWVALGNIKGSPGRNEARAETLVINDLTEYFGIRGTNNDHDSRLRYIRVDKWLEKVEKYKSINFPLLGNGVQGYAIPQNGNRIPNDTFIGFYLDFTPRAFSPSSDNEIFRFTTSGNFNYQFIYRNLTPGDSRQWIGWLTSGSNVTAALLTLTANRRCRILFQYIQGVWTICVDGTNRVLTVGNAGAVASLNGYLKIGGRSTASPMSFDLNDLRFFKTSLNEAQMLEITKGDVNKYLNKSNCPIMFKNFDSHVVIKNRGSSVGANLDALGCFAFKDKIVTVRDFGKPTKTITGDYSYDSNYFKYDYDGISNTGVEAWEIAVSPGQPFNLKSVYPRINIMFKRVKVWFYLRNRMYYNPNYPLLKINNKVYTCAELGISDAGFEGVHTFEVDLYGSYLDVGFEATTLSGTYEHAFVCVLKVEFLT